MKYIVNDNGTDREMTEQEIATFTADAVKAQQDDAAMQAWFDAKTAALASARAKLAALGLTEAEIKALVG